MLKGIYDEFIRGIAGRNVVSKKIIPGVELAIGDAEILNPILSPYMLPVTREMKTPTMADVKTMDDLRDVGRGPQVFPADFFYSNYLGEEVYHGY